MDKTVINVAIVGFVVFLIVLTIGGYDYNKNLNVQKYKTIEKIVNSNSSEQISKIKIILLNGERDY